MNKTFAYILNKLEINDNIIADLRHRTISVSSLEQASTVLAEIKFRIDLCLETRCKEDKPYYFMFHAYCNLYTDKREEAVNATTYAIDDFRVCGLSWNEVVGHWFLGSIYATESRGYLYLAELNLALDIANPLYQELIIQGEYEQAAKYQKVISKLESQKQTATKMGTGPLRMPTESLKFTDDLPSMGSEDYLVLPWLPSYNAVKATPNGLIWDRPVKEIRSSIRNMEINSSRYTIYSLQRQSPTDHQVTLVEHEQYGWAKVEGKSMNASLPTSINEGDQILFHINIKPRDGDIVVASELMASGNYAYMVKRYRALGNELVSETNDKDPGQSYDPIKLDGHHQILGIVIAVAKPAR